MLAESIKMTGSKSCALSTLMRGLLDVAAIEDRIITGLTLNSNLVTTGSLFCAVRGTEKHGMSFADQAVAQGAVAILADGSVDGVEASEWSPARCAATAQRLGVPVLLLPELGRNISTIAGRFYGDPGANLDLIGITGTNGKTSVCQFIAQALNPDPICGVVGTLGYGIPNTLISTGCTTPDAINLQAMLAHMRAQGAKAVAMEISSHALDQHRAAGLPINIAVFTNLTRDHLDYHHNLGAYAQAKRRLFTTPGLRHAVLNADDPMSMEILAELDSTVEPVLYSLNPGFLPPRPSLRWLRLTFLEHQPRGMRLWISGSWGRGDITVPILGRFNAANLLAALAVLLLRDPDLDAALRHLGSVRGVPGRMQCFGESSQPLVVVDYAHTPDALEQVLTELRAHQPHRLITLFGCGGERDRGKRPQMGSIAERLSDLIILTDDNPRSENGEHIVQDILAGMERPSTVQVERQRDKAIHQAINAAKAGDIVLIAGKGHENTQRIGAIDYPFSDHAVVANVLGTPASCP